MLEGRELVTLKEAERRTGLTVKAMERKIERGDWLEGREYHRAPDGRVFISLKGFEAWVVSGQGSKSGQRASASRSRSTEPSSATP